MIIGGSFTSSIKLCHISKCSDLRDLEKLQSSTIEGNAGFQTQIWSYYATYKSKGSNVREVLLKEDMLKIKYSIVPVTDFFLPIKKKSIPLTVKMNRAAKQKSQCVCAGAEP